eukprot:6463361-Amphidinium_carterae.1
MHQRLILIFTARFSSAWAYFQSMCGHRICRCGIRPFSNLPTKVTMGCEAGLGGAALEPATAPSSWAL